MPRWLTPTLAGALALSVLLHLGLALGDSAWALREADSLDEPVVTPTERKLKQQSLNAADADALASVTPVDTLVIRFGRPASPAPLAVPTRPAKQPPRPPTSSAVRHVERSSKALPQPLALLDPPVPEPMVVAEPAPAVVDAAVSADPTSGATAAPPAAEPAAPSAPARPTLNIDPGFPRRIDVAYIAKGLVEAEHHWRAEGNRYRIETRAEFVGRSFELRSEGEIGAHGLIPHRFTEWRSPQTATPRYQIDFDWAGRQVRYGEPGQQKQAELAAGAQDIFSAAYQFALQGSALPTFTLQIVTGRNSYQVPFELKGEAELLLSGRRISTLVLAGQHDKRRFQFYLAPDWHNLPVRIAFDDGTRSVDLTAVAISLDGRPVLERIERAPRDR
ncbi:DUF3108 domain-containing protein [Chitinimonas lacunae]|uniref:DUF3108 domain-containing protein n=1 Tax=Chitinimonas lacunae TaxID=1963018 RepID=A0ABV8MSA4_9NEIS